MANNLPTITVEDFTTIVEMQFREKNNRPIFGLGKGGIGKTESIKELAQRMNIGYIDVRLLMYSEVDLKGIPYPNNENNATVWLQNNILPKVERDGDRGILVLDEITSVARSVRTAAYQLLNERRLGEYSLPDGWMVVCLGNGEEDGGDYQGMEGNFANRCSIFNVVPNVEAWKKWAYSSGINYLVLSYITWRPSELHTFDADSESDMLFASPRSWKAVSDILNANGYDKDDRINNLRIISNVGTRVGNNFLAFCKYKESTVDPNDIVSGKDVGVINETEVLMITIQSVIKILADSIKGDITTRGAISGETVVKCANGVRWMVGLPRVEHQVMALKDFIMNDRSTVTKLLLNSEFNKACPEIMEFAKNNSQIFR